MSKGLEVCVQVADDESGEQGWRMRMLQVPRAGEYLVVGHPDDAGGYVTWLVVSVHWQIRRADFHLFEMAILEIEAVK